jgi:rhodanese-related sulfurtransferase
MPLRKTFRTLAFFLLLFPTACSGPAGHVPVGTPQAMSLHATLQPTSTPIPNLRVEAFLDEAFGRFVVYLAHHSPVIGMEAFQESLAHQTLFLLDVRQPLEVRAAGYIDGAILIPLRELGRKTSLLPDYTVPIVAYCSDGWRATLALAGLGVFGWDIHILQGGSQAWLAMGGAMDQGALPMPEVDPSKPAFPCCGIYEAFGDPGEAIETDTDAPDPALVAAIQRMFARVPADHGLITPEELDLALDQSRRLVILDVRSQDAMDEGGDIPAENVIHVPFERLIESRSRWPEDRGAEIVVVSDDGFLSTVAMAILWTYGYEDARSLQGGHKGWLNPAVEPSGSGE